MQFYRRHRLLVALPVLVALLALTASAHVQQHTQVPEDVASVRTIADEEGDVLLAEEGLIEAEAGPFTLLGWSGGFTASMQGEKVTVAAITTPVVVRDAGGRRLVVPLRYQWTGAALPEEPVAAAAALRMLPAAYLQEQLRRLPDAPAAREDAPAESSLASAIDDVLGFLRLPRAKQRAGESELQNDRSRALTFLQRGSSAGVLGAASSDRLLALFPAAVERGMTQWLLPSFLDDADRWLLGSLHPVLREHTWTADPPVSSPRDRLLRLLLLVQGDVLPQGPSDRVIERWGEGVAELVRTSDDSKMLLAQSVPVFTDAVERCAKRGYLHRSRRYAAALLDALEPWRTSMPEPLAGSLQRLAQLEHPEPPEDLTKTSDEGMNEPKTDASVSSSKVSIEEIRARTIEALRSAGALFTVRTAIEPIPGSASARVTDIALPTRTGDRFFSFTFEPVTGTVSAASRDGRSLPYAVPLSVFIAWAETLH